MLYDCDFGAIKQPSVRKWAIHACSCDQSGGRQHRQWLQHTELVALGVYGVYVVAYARDHIFLAADLAASFLHLLDHLVDIINGDGIAHGLLGIRSGHDGAIYAAALAGLRQPILHARHAGIADLPAEYLVKLFGSFHILGRNLEVYYPSHCTSFFVRTSL